MPKDQNLQFKQLYDNFFKINREVEAIILSNVDGQILYKEKREDINIDIISDLTSLINSVVQRIRDEFALQQFGTASFNTEKHRLLFVSVTKGFFLIFVIVPAALIDKVTSYAYFLAEKTAQILTAEEGDVIQLMVPKFEYETKEKNRLKNQLYQTRLDYGKKYRYKFIIIGDKEVGKTSIVRRFTENKFSHDYRATIGLNLISHSINFMGNDIELFIWDIGAQKYYKRFRKTYYQGAQAVFIVFDMANKESYDNIEEWFNEINEFIKMDDLSIIIVGNKSDLKNERQIDYEKGINISNILYNRGISNISYIETSALTGENIREAFRLISFHYILKNTEFEEDKLKYDIVNRIKSILNSKENLTISFITEHQYWSLGLQILTNIASRFILKNSIEKTDLRKYEYENGLIIKNYNFDFGNLTDSDAVFCIFDARNRKHIITQWRIIIKNIIETMEQKKVLLIGIRVNESTDWSNIKKEFNINEYIENKQISLLFVKIGEKYRIEIFDHLKVMFNTLESLI